MNSFRIMYDLEFVENHKSIVEKNMNMITKKELTQTEEYDIRKVYTIYLTIYELFMKDYNNDDDFINFESEYKKIYNKYALQMLDKAYIKNKCIIHNYKFHVDSLHSKFKEHFNKHLEDMSIDSDNETDKEDDSDEENKTKNITINVTQPATPNPTISNILLLTLPPIIINLCIINTLIILNLRLFK